MTRPDRVALLASIENYTVALQKEPLTKREAEVTRLLLAECLWKLAEMDQPVVSTIH